MKNNKVRQYVCSESAGEAASERPQRVGHPRWVRQLFSELARSRSDSSPLNCLPVCRHTETLQHNFVSPCSWSRTASQLCT